MEENWLPVPGYEEFYEVSDQGRVRSFPRRHRVAGGKYGVRQPKLLSPAKRSVAGHLAVSLRRDGKNKEFFVAVLVLTAFVGPRPKGMYGCHNDGNPANNSLSNLRWDTPSENSKDRFRHWAGKPRVYRQADQSPIEGERWLPVVGFEDRYQVSDHGRVKGPSGTVRHIGPSHHGHRQIHLVAGDKKRTTYVHTLVLEAFVGPRPEKHYACHINGTAAGDGLENLRWDTPSANNRDAVRHGTHANAKKTHCPKGHPLDGTQASGRSCTECRRIRGRKRRAAKTTCPQGHPFDGVRYKADGTVRQRYCTNCAHAALDRGRRAPREPKTHCKNGHEFDGVVYRPDGSVKQRFCKTCRNARRQRWRAERKTV